MIMSKYHRFSTVFLLVEYFPMNFNKQINKIDFVLFIKYTPTIHFNSRKMRTRKSSVKQSEIISHAIRWKNSRFSCSIHVNRFHVVIIYIVLLTFSRMDKNDFSQIEEIQKKLKTTHKKQKKIQKPIKLLVTVIYFGRYSLVRLKSMMFQLRQIE